MTEEQQRAEFESAYAKTYPVSCSLKSDPFARDPEAPDEYDATPVQIGWVMWQAARTTPPMHEPNAKLMELAERIDHEELWRRSGLERLTMPQQQRDRLDAGVALRRYADLLGNGGWRLYPPRPGLCFRAGTLDSVVDMARKDEARRAERAVDPYLQCR